MVCISYLIWCPLSYVTPFVAMYLSFGPECLSILFSFSTLIGDSVIVKRVYRGFMVFVSGIKSFVDLIELDMVDFEVILGMY